jgi:ribosomal protein S21
MGPLSMAMIGLAGNSINAFAQYGQNRKEREFSKYMYELQRQDALSDYHMQNAYNDPSAQVKRLKEAGLNPALMYGKSASPGLAGSVRSSDFKSPSTNAPRFGDALTYLPQMFDFEVKQAQSNNLDALSKTEEKKALLVAAQANAQTTDAEIKRATKGVAIASAKAALDKLEADTQLQIGENARRELITGYTIQEKLVNALKAMKQTEHTAALIKEVRESTLIKEAQRKMWDQNINPNDSLLVRLLGKLLENGPTLKEFKEGITGGALRLWLGY